MLKMFINEKPENNDNFIIGNHSSLPYANSNSDFDRAEN